MSTREEILTRIQEFVAEKKWDVPEFANKMKVTRATIYKLYNGTTDPQTYFIRLGEEGCDLNWLRTGEKTTGNSPLFMSKEQARLLGFAEEIGIFTLEDLRQVFAPNMTIEQLIAFAQQVELKVMKYGVGNQVPKKTQTKKKNPQK